MNDYRTSFSQRCSVLYEVGIPLIVVLPPTPGSMSQIGELVKSLHERSMTHGSLAPSSFVRHSSDVCWRFVDLEHKPCVEKWRSASCLPNRYFAPEIAQAIQHSQARIQLDPAADMWSLGIIAFELLTCTERRIPCFAHRQSLAAV